MKNKPIAAIELDPRHQTADSDFRNNRFPPTIHQSRLEAYKSERKRRNLMADLLVELKTKADTADQKGQAVPLSSEQ